MKVSLDQIKKIKYTEILDFDLVMEVTYSFVFTSSGGRDDTYMNFLYSCLWLAKGMAYTFSRLSKSSRVRFPCSQVPCWTQTIVGRNIPKKVMLVFSTLRFILVVSSYSVNYLYSIYIA